MWWTPKPSGLPEPSLRGEIAAFFAAPAESLKVHVDIDKDHGRIETRRCVVSHDVAWMGSNRRYPGEYRFTKLAAIAMVEATREAAGGQSTAPLDPARLAQALRAHWRIENSLHWVLDVVFREDLSRLRKGHGATGSSSSAAP